MAEPADIQLHVKRALTDSGYFARNIFGWNFDETGEQEKINVGTGGIRPYGPHQEMMEALDGEERFVHIEMPRGSYKSTALQSYMGRLICANPDIRIMYFARTDSLALEKSMALRNAMEMDAVTEVFGPQKNEGTWEQRRWTVATRRQKNLQNATFSAWSQDSMPTGGRANVVIVDDWIDQKDLHTPEANEKSKKIFRYLAPFVAKGGKLVVVGTRYGEDDIYSELLENPLYHPPTGKTLIVGAGVEVIKNDKGHLDLVEAEGGLTFPHQTMDFLRSKLLQMAAAGEFYEFSCQYLNEVPSGAGNVFRRWMFKPINWKHDMEGLSGFLLTDTATSQEDEGCHSVVAYIGLDSADNYYVLDVRAGHWSPHEFVEQFFDVLEHWQQRVNHVGEVWEDISLTTVFNYAIEQNSRSRRTKLRPISIKRYASKAKKARIMRLHGPMSEGKFFVCNTVPRTFDDNTGTHPMFDPEGFFDPKAKIKQPSGELVNQFVKLGSYGKMDIADALAMALEYEKKKNRALKRYCQYRPYTGGRRRNRRGGIPQQRADDYHQRTYGQDAPGKGWWDSVTGNLYHDE